MPSAVSRRFQITSELAENEPLGGGRWLRGRLLAVAHQDLVAGMGQLRTILLKAGQNGQVVLIHDGATIFLDIVSAGLLLLGGAATLLRLLLLSDRPGGSRQRQQGEYQEKITHRVPLS